MPLLVQHFLKLSNQRNKRDIRITAQGVQVLANLSWPGNVRELENFIERLAIFCVSGEIGVADVEREASNKRKFAAAPAAASGEGRPTLLSFNCQPTVRVLQD